MANVAANGHGAAEPAPKPDTIFAEQTVDAGDIPGLGHVIIHEAALKDIWPYMTSGEGPAMFGIRVLAASIEIDGRRYTFDEIMNIGMKHMAQLQTLLPAVRKINGLDFDVDAGDDDDEQKKGEAAGTGDTPAA
jgi:hypothetical protein